jgi:hypothetical protein
LKTDFAELDISDLETESNVDDQDEWEELNNEQLLAVMSEMDNIMNLDGSNVTSSNKSD